MPVDFSGRLSGGLRVEPHLAFAAMELPAAPFLAVRRGTPPPEMDALPFAPSKGGLKAMLAGAVLAACAAWVISDRSKLKSRAHNAERKARLRQSVVLILEV